MEGIMKQDRIQKLMLYSYNTVKHYRNMFDDYGIDPASVKSIESLDKLPLLTKEMIQQSPDDYISNDYQFFPKRDNLIIKRTSGSTGRYLKVYWDKNDEMESLLSMWLFREKNYHIYPHSKFCSFYTTIYNNNKFIEAEKKQLLNKGVNLGFSKIELNEKNIIEYFNEMNAFKPEWILVQPSIAYLLARHIANNGLKLPDSLKYIELTGEYLYDNMKQDIKSAFGVETANQYGCNEVNGIAMECKNGHMHCLSSNVIVEILKDGKRVDYGEEGDIYITSLTNTAMPIIRYAIGDRGKLLRHDVCSCGNKNDILIILNGRNCEFVSLQNGEKINSYVFLYTIERINEYMGNPILQFRIIQESVNDFYVEFVLKESYKGWFESIKKAFIENIKVDQLQKANWKFRSVNYIFPDANSGKVHFFINKLILTANERSAV